MIYDKTVEVLEATRFSEFKFFQITDCESIIRQIPDVSPYIDVLISDEEPLPKERPLTKNGL